MFRVIVHGLLARKFRLFATALAVTLGVAFMAGTMVLTDTIGNTFNNLSSGVYKGTDAEVRAKVAFSAPTTGGGDQRPLISAALVQTLHRVPGVAADEASAMGYARLIGSNGKALGNPAAGAPTLGGNWNQVKQLNPWTLVAGHPPQAANQVVIDNKSATDGHLRVGDMTTVLALGPPAWPCSPPRSRSAWSPGPGRSPASCSSPSPASRSSNWPATCAPRSRTGWRR